MTQLSKASFFLTVEGFNQKSRTATYPAADNFTLSEHLNLKLDSSALKADNSTPLELRVIVESGGRKGLYALKLVEWRFVLAFGSLSVDIELPPYHHDGLSLMQSVGILSIELALSPLPKHFKIT